MIEQLSQEDFDLMKDAELVTYFRMVLEQEDIAKKYRQAVETEITARLTTKEEAGEKATIQLRTGESVSLGEEIPYFKYNDVDAAEVHRWVKSIGLGNIIKEPKIHNASLNSNLRDLVKRGVEIPSFMNIESRRQLTKRGMK